MALYETIFITRHDISLSEVNKIAEHYINFVNNNGGKVLKTENWGLRNFAYKIRKSRKGYYFLLVLDVFYKTLVEIERQMKLNESIIKNVTFKIDEFDPEPSPMMEGSGKSEEDEVQQEPSKDLVQEHRGE